MVRRYRAGADCDWGLGGAGGGIIRIAILLAHRPYIAETSQFLGTTVVIFSLRINMTRNPGQEFKTGLE